MPDPTLVLRNRRVEVEEHAAIAQPLPQRRATDDGEGVGVEAGEPERDAVGFERGQVAEVAEVRRNGWARQREEIHEGIAGFAAPIGDRGGKLLAALVVMGPTARIDEQAERIVAALLAEARALSVEVGALSPEPDAEAVLA